MCEISLKLSINNNSYLWKYFTYFTGVSIVDFEQVIAGWVGEALFLDIWSLNKIEHRIDS